MMSSNLLESRYIWGFPTSTLWVWAKLLKKKRYNMVSLNFALVGCGRIAKRHSELLGLGQISNARLAQYAILMKKGH